jgi:hypothetical protein
VSAGPITPADTVAAYGILIAVGFLAVLGVVLVLLGLRWLGGQGRDR